MKAVQAVSEKKTLKDLTILYINIAQGQGQIAPPTPKFSPWPNSFTTLIIHCKFQPLYSLLSIEKMIFQHFLHTIVWRCKFDYVVKRSMVNLRPSFGKLSRP